MSTIQGNYLKTITEKVKVQDVQRRTDSIAAFWQSAETNRFGIIPLLLVFVASVSAMAAAYAVQGNEFELIAISLSAMCVEVLVIAVMPMRSIVVAALVALIISLLVIIPSVC